MIVHFFSCGRLLSLVRWKHSAKTRFEMKNVTKFLLINGVSFVFRTQDISILKIKISLLQLCPLTPDMNLFSGLTNTEFPRIITVSR